MKRRMRPIDRTRSVSMFDRIEMYVINVGLKIPIIANGVLPETFLPQPVYTAVILLNLFACAHELPGKSRLDQTYAPRIGAIPRR